MKNHIKIILAWLDWSTYCRDSDSGKSYQFPPSLCSLFWRTILSLAALPITWVTHVWNFSFVSKKAFIHEETRSHKLDLISTVIFTTLTLVSATYVHQLTDGENGSGGWGWDWFHHTDPIVLSYFKTIGAGLLGLVVLAIMLAVIILCIFLIHKLLTHKFKIIKKQDDGLISKVTDSIKDKYCPTIDWKLIRKKREQ